jgi:CHAD domain-containing protein
MSWDCQYNIPNNLSVRGLTQRLKKHVACTIDAQQSMKRTFYDTYDWRAYASGRVIEEQRVNSDNATLHLRSLNDPGTQGIVTRSQESLRFIQDLPNSAVRRELASIIEMRALLPLASMRSLTTSLRLLDDNQKTVAYLKLEENQLLNAAGRIQGEPIRRACLVPVKGYTTAATRLSHLLNKDLDLEPTDEDMLITVLATSSRRPGDYSSKLNLELDRNMRADAASKIILRRLLDIMQANENGIRNSIDIEFLHDFRVAVRRTRSAIMQLKNIFPDRTRNRYRRSFQWLQQITGPARDTDVYLLKFADYQALVEPSLRPALAPLRNFLQQRNKNEYRRLTRRLDSTRYHKLIADWRAFLDQPSSKRSTPSNAARPIGDVASERIWRLYRRAIKTGRSINDNSPARDLHELRKTCKKLRYMLEFFHGVYPQGDIKKLIRALKQLQDNLGDFNDLQVQSDVLQQFSKEIHAKGSTGPETLMAFGNLVAALRQQRELKRQEFYSHYEKFARPAVAARFNRLFHDVADNTTTNKTT